jgi:maltose O-acetyltransferase
MTSMHNYDSSDSATLPFDDTNLLRPIKIEKFCWIGTNVIILPGVTIGEGSVIGAGSIVTHNIPKMAVCAGNPAKVIKYRNPKQYHELSAQNISWVEKYRNKHPFRMD